MTCMAQLSCMRDAACFKWGNRAMQMSQCSATPARGGLYPPPSVNKSLGKTSMSCHVVFLVGNLHAYSYGDPTSPMHTRMDILQTPCILACILAWISLPMQILAWASLPGGPPPGTRREGPHVAPHMYPLSPASFFLFFSNLPGGPPPGT